MNMSQFEDGLDRYGADFDRWPQTLRGDALRFIEISAGGSAARAAMAEVEFVLRSTAYSDKQPINAIAARAVRHPQIRPVRHATRHAARVVVAATALLLGLFVGSTLPEHHGNPDGLMSAAFEPMEFTDVD